MRTWHSWRSKMDWLLCKSLEEVGVGRFTRLNYLKVMENVCHKEDCLGTQGAAQLVKKESF
ncbi:Adenylosuccinate lyase [Sesbania bispinosa]|nr:Adenylosuccinate lyase [Sesbania bispinosa]